MSAWILMMCELMNKCIFFWFLEFTLCTVSTLKRSDHMLNGEYQSSPIQWLTFFKKVKFHFVCSRVSINDVRSHWIRKHSLSVIDRSFVTFAYHSYNVKSVGLFAGIRFEMKEDWIFTKCAHKCLSRLMRWLYDQAYANKIKCESTNC